MCVGRGGGYTAADHLFIRVNTLLSALDPGSSLSDGDHMADMGLVGKRPPRKLDPVLSFLGELAFGKYFLMMVPWK